MEIRRERKICFVVASELTATAFLLDHISALSRLYDVTVAANTRSTDFLSKYGIEARVFSTRVERRISPFQDLSALVSLARLFRKERFAAVHSVTPKAGLLAALAGFLARVPVRIHTFTGQVWVTRSGLSRWLLKRADRLVAALTTHILVDSRSQRDFLVAERVISRDKSVVLAKGSISGVDTARFRPDPEARSKTRAQSKICDTDTLFLFLGRLNRDKGVVDLAEAFSKVRAVRADVRLLYVGPDEENMLPLIRRACISCPEALHHVGQTPVPQQYLASADVLCLPSYREGFGSVIIEAAAAGVPAIATRIYGVTDAVEEGVTGLLYEPGNVDLLTEAMLRFAANAGLRRQMGENALVRARRDFPKEAVTAALLDYYRVTLWGHSASRS